MSTFDAAQQQPKPSGTGPDIATLVCADIQRRAEVGEKTYGERLKAFNGRNPILDAYQESLDQSMYLRQAIEEIDRLKARIAALESGLEQIIRLEPCLDSGACFYPMHDPEGNEIGGLNVDPIGVVKNMASKAQDTLHNRNTVSQIDGHLD